MSELMNRVNQHLSDEVIIQLTRQLGAPDPNQVKVASQAISELLLQAISSQANDQQRGGGLMGAIEKDHDGGILGNLVEVLTGQKQVNNNKTMNGAGIIGHLLGQRQVEAAQMVSKHTGLDFFKSGVLMQLLAPIVMGVVGQKQRSNGLDLGGLAKILLGGGGGQQQNNQPTSNRRGSGGGGLFGKLLDRDGDGSAMDDLLDIGMNILKKK